MLSKGPTPVYKDHCVRIHLCRSTYIFKGKTATARLFHPDSPAEVPQVCSFFAVQVWSFYWYTFYYKIPLTWQICVSWSYKLNVKADACTLSALTRCFHNCLTSSRVESCSCAEVQTPLHRPCQDQVLQVLPVGEARKKMKQNILLEMVGCKTPLRCPAENRDCCMLH